MNLNLQRKSKIFVVFAAAHSVFMLPAAWANQPDAPPPEGARPSQLSPTTHTNTTAPPADTATETTGPDEDIGPATETTGPDEDIGPAADETNKKSYEPEVSGFLQVFFRQAFETGSDGVVDNSNFRVMRARVRVKGKLMPRVQYVIEVDPRAPTVGGFMRDAYISIKLWKGHRLRVGQQKTQFGYENVSSSTRLYVVNRSEVADALMRGVNLRDQGLGLVGNLNLTSRLRLEDAITVTNGAPMNTQDDDTPMKNVWGRVGLRYSPDAFSLWWGISGGIGDLIDTGDLDLDPTDDFKVRFKRIGTDLRIDTRWAFLATEFVWGQDRTALETADMIGYYATLVGKTPWRIGPIVRLDDFDGEKRRWTVGAYYGLADERLRLMLNYEYRELMEEDVRGDDKFYVWLQGRF